MRRMIFQEDDAAVLQSLYNLAHLYEDQGKVALAESLYRRTYPSTSQLGYYDPRIALASYSLGSLLITGGNVDEAERALTGSLAMQRRLFPDSHPDIARTIAELGRLAHTRGRFVEAEQLYRSSLERLGRALGTGHPDYIAVANNLAVLLAERGRPHVAEQLLSVSTLSLTEPGRPEIPYLPARVPAMQAEVGHQQEEVLFFDNFNDGVFDPDKWEFGGSRVVEQQGELQITANIADHPGWARTLPIAINPQLPLIVRRRVKVHAANQYFDGTLNVHIIGYPERRFGVSYANYHYTGAGESVTVGFSLFRHDSNSHNFAERRENASSLIPPIWDQWFNEELAYDPLTGEVRYSINGTLRLTYNVGVLPRTARSIMLTFETWGWYTEHSQFLDYLWVGQ
jgi:tetratricopeptide (TPR) repeat protein